MQGLLLINKPEGITSFRAVSIIKRLSSEKRVGHTGTLDPMATGVLPVFLGRATALSSYLLEADKTYLAGVKLGITTDTLDTTGEVLTRSAVNVSEERLDSLLREFTGEITQIPPAYSALKKDGVCLYKLARQGKPVQAEPRRIRINSIERVTGLENGMFSVRVSCSKGTYIRSLCDDIGKALGCGAAMCSLCREETHGFSLERCVSLDTLNSGNISEYILPEEEAVKGFRRADVSDRQAVRFSNGGELDINRLQIKFERDNEIIRVKHGDVFLGLGRYDASRGAVVIQCVINKPL